MKRSRPQPIGDRIRQGRLQLGLSQGQVAERTGLTQTSLSRYETGAANPSEPSLRLLAAIFDKPYEWFFGEEEEPQGGSGRVKAPESATQPTPESSDVIVSLGERLQDFSARFDRLETYIRAQAPVQAIAESRANYDPSNIASLNQLAGLLNTVGDAAKTLLSLRKSEPIKSELSEIVAVVGMATMAAATAQTDYLAAGRRIRELEEENLRMKAWDAEAEQYQLQEVDIGAFALVYQPAVDNPQPVHWLCTNCAEAKRKSILQSFGKDRGAASYRIYGCICGQRIRVNQRIVEPSRYS